jgi:PAS domain S-box-containing protein
MLAEHPSRRDPAERCRVEMLRASGLLDAERIEVFDRLARAASHALHAPVAQVNLLTEDRQIPRGSYGPEPWRSTEAVDLDHSLCQHVVASAEPLVVPDTTKDPLTWSSLATTELKIAAYAGAPLIVGDCALGSLCVVDFVPHPWTPGEVEVLRDLAAVASSEIEDRIGEHERALAALSESQNRYRTLAESDPDAILEIGEDSVILAANPAVERIFGYLPEELVGRPLSTLMPERMREAHDRGIARYIATGRRNIPWEGIELPALTKAGDEIVTEVSFGEYTLEGRRVFAGFIRDVTARKQAERFRAAEHGVTRALSESHTLEQAAPGVLSAIGTALDWHVGALWIIDRQGDSLRCVDLWHSDLKQTPAFAEASRDLSFRRGEGLPGRVWANGVPEWVVDVQADPRFPRASAAAGEGLHSAFAFPVRSGEETLGVVEFFSHAIQQPDDELLRMVEIIGADVGHSIRRVQAEEERDRVLSELSRLNADLQSTNERLEERTAEAEAASRTRSEFVATMSHELRTPLNAVIGYADLLQAGIPEPIPPAAAKQVKRIGLSAKHLLEMIEEVLTFSRVEAGREKTKPAPTRVGEILEEIEALFQHLANDKGLELNVVRPEPEIVAETDAGKVRHILLQLLDNAVKFTERGDIEVRAEAEGEDLIFSVRDSGPGIPPEHRSRIFDPFWQAEQSTTRSAEGTGMGLSVSNKLAELMGGELQFDSTPGKGSTFRLRLPLRGYVAAPEAIEATSPGHDA